MLEKEIKILEIDRDAIVKKLEAFGAEKTFEGIIHDVYYDFPSDGKKDKMQENNRMFRVRQKGETHLYTIKNKRFDVEEEEDVIAKDEHEMEISDVNSFSEVLEKYGMIKTREKKKHRISYRLVGAEFDFDTYEGIPALLEIEEESQDNIDFWLRKLELTEEKIFLGGSKKLFKHYGKEYMYL
ncbi:MAG: CYTH domain-containing protein [Candidatus Gracilibacteria bacterium]|nr:CYTH domain-containing protein [Candidatus Gracilibacteria bacterium]